MNEKQVVAIWLGHSVPGYENVLLMGSWQLGQLPGDCPVTGEDDGVAAGVAVALCVRVAVAVADAAALADGVDDRLAVADGDTHDAMRLSWLLVWSAMKRLSSASTATP